jgi:hypothetical protein
MDPEGAVQLRGAGAVAVAQQAVVLAAQPVHLGAGGVGGELGGLAVEGVDFLADGDVLISDGAAGDFLWRTQVSQPSEMPSGWRQLSPRTHGKG